MVKQYFCNCITRSKSLIWLLQQSIDPTLQLLAACPTATIHPNATLHSKLHLPCMYTTIVHVIGHIITPTSFLSSTSTNEHSLCQVFAAAFAQIGDVLPCGATTLSKRYLRRGHQPYLRLVCSVLMSNSKSLGGGRTVALALSACEGSSNESTNGLIAVL